MKGSPLYGVKSMCLGYCSLSTIHSFAYCVLDSLCWNTEIVHQSEVRDYDAVSRYLLKNFSARQEKLLQGLMTEIVRMKAQHPSSEGGVPLYPFSHATLFRKGESSHPANDEHIVIAPLPISPHFQDRELSSSPSHCPRNKAQ
jgi:hypothetical protein